MTVLAPSLTLRFGGLRYETHASRLEVDLGLLPAVNMLRCVLPPSVEVDAAPGDPAEAALNNGEGRADVLTGTVRSVSRGLRGTEVVAGDAGAALAAIRPAAVYQSMSPVEAIQAFAAEAGVQAAVLLAAPGRLPAYVADQRRTAAEHVARLAFLGGGLAHVDASGVLTVMPRPVPPAAAALLYGRELLEFSADEHAAEPDLSLIAAGPAGSGADPRALALSPGPLTGGADDPGPRNVWQAVHALRSPLALSPAAEEARAARATRTRRMRAICWLLPALRPGAVIEVQGLPDGVSGGPWLLTSVSHHVDRTRGGVTRLEGVGGDSGGLLSALGGLGGLL